MSAIAYWQSFLFRLAKPFAWLWALALWPAVLGWLGWWLIPKWFDIPVRYLDLTYEIALICTAAGIVGVVVWILLFLVSLLFFGTGGAAYFDEKGRPYPDDVIEAIKLAEAKGQRVTERKISEFINKSRHRPNN